MSSSNARRNIPMPTAGGLFQRVQEIDFLADLECKELKVEIDKIQNKSEPAIIDRTQEIVAKMEREICAEFEEHKKCMAEVIRIQGLKNQQIQKIVMDLRKEMLELQKTKLNLQREVADIESMIG